MTNQGKFPTRSIQSFLPVNVDMFIEKIKVALFDGRMTDLQIESVKAIMNQCLIQSVLDIRCVAYIFASAYYDSYNPRTHPNERLVPTNEIGSSPTLRGLAYYPYYGRSFSQLRYKHHYRSESLRHDLDILYDPDLMLDINVSANTHVYALNNGLHWGRKLGDFIYGNYANYTKCRRCTSNRNGRWEVAEIAFKFEYCLRESAIAI